MSQRRPFWLHIKKSGGTSTRSLLQPYYVEVDREKRPKTFIQARPEEYNDILNNFRVVLGEYQFKRCLFARKYLYPEEWEHMFSFAFSREPVDRCVSMFHYLFWSKPGRIQNIARSMMSNRKLILKTSYAFDVFLESIQQARLSDSVYSPFGLHFTTHTAPMWGDITDSNGNVLLNEVYRIESLRRGINEVFEQCMISKRVDDSGTVMNQTRLKARYMPTTKQKKKIESLYSRDFEIYENASR